MTNHRASLSRRISIAFAASLGLSSLASSVSAAPAAPSGAHPRLWLSNGTLATMQSKLGSSSSAASSVVQGCDKILLPEKAGELQQAGIQGYNWAYSSLTCALAWKLTGDAKYAVPAVTLFRAMLDDYATLGDGAGGDTVVQHDTGYGMRFYAAYSALLYDWMHDAPGVDGTLLAHARARFSAWTDWYDASGYLNTTPGSNYHAGYVFAKTLIAIAQASEGGNDAYWSDVVDRIFPQQMIANGLAPKGALAGGDWPEGWQYGTMSTLDYALAARSLAEQGVTFPAISAWADALAVRYAYGMNPARTGQYVGGDLDDAATDAPLNPRALIGAIAGPGSAQAAGWAQLIKSKYATAPDICPVYDALAEARGAAPSDFAATKPALSYLASGTRNLYARSSWDPSATWAVFTSAPRIVPDHQHFDASNFVLEHGADALIVDPSPYGSRSSLTANAITVDSHTVESSYAPSQSPWGKADLAFTHSTVDGVAAARGEIGAAFDADTGANDVALARRDWTFLPEGEVVTIDRVRTGDATRSAYLRFRTTAALAMSGSTAIGKVGASQVAIHAVAKSGGSAVVQPITVGDCWDSNAYGQCAKGRFAANEYAVTLPGPSAWAVHVIDALGASEAPASVVSMNDASIDPSGDSAVIGASITRGASRTYVLGANTEASPATMTYAVPADMGARHVVFDAPADGGGRSTVTAAVKAGRCVVTITPGGSIEGKPAVFHVGSAAEGCAVAGSSAGSSGSSGGSVGSSGGSSGSSGSSGGSSGSGGSVGSSGGSSGSSGGSSGSSGGSVGSSGSGGSSGGSGGSSGGLPPIDPVAFGSVGCSASPTRVGGASSSLFALAGGLLVAARRRNRRRASA